MKKYAIVSLQKNIRLIIFFMTYCNICQVLLKFNVIVKENKKRKDKKMNIEEEIQRELKKIESLDFVKKGLNMNENIVAKVLCVSASTLASWRKQGIGVDYIPVGRRVLYPKIALAEFQVKRKIKTA
jgi:uncharacterized protein YlbG (UPF0298 family)